MRLLPHLAKVAVLALSAYFALWACAPSASFRPITLDLDAPHEIGVGGTASADAYGYYGSDAQLWYAQRVGKKFSLGGTVFGGATDVVGVGFLGRYHAIEGEKFRLGVDFEAGFLYAAAGLPIAFKLADSVWLYTNPSVGLRSNGIARLPLGAQFNLGKHFVLGAEVAGLYGNSSLAAASPEQLAFVGGVSAAWRW